MLSRLNWLYYSLQPNSMSMSTKIPKFALGLLQPNFWFVSEQLQVQKCSECDIQAIFCKEPKL